MYAVVNWTEDLDLTEFYAEAEQRGFANNASQKAMIDCFCNETEWAAWILYQNDKAVGSVAAHSFTAMGPNAYRVLARTCTFGTARQNGGLITPRKLIAEHQNLTDQFLLPKCIEWAGHGKMYATSNASKVSTAANMKGGSGASSMPRRFCTSNFVLVMQVKGVPQR
jgi:hypothetical protein